jgi:hypothetical protein
LEAFEAGASPPAGSKKAIMANVSFGDSTRGNLRTAVAAVEREISRLPATGDTDASPDELRALWSKLVKMLALGPAPETRQCPVCSGTGMRAASRCAHCWAKLEPLAEAGPAAARSDA